MHTFLASLLSSHVPFVHFDGLGTVSMVSPEARLLLGLDMDTRLEPLAEVARSIASAPPVLAIPREFSVRSGHGSIQVAAMPVTVAPAHVDVLMVLALGAAPAHRYFENRQLTAREREIAQKVAIGMPSPAIAQMLGISVHTVRRHTERVFSKTGVKSRTELARFVARLHAGHQATA